MRERGKYQLQLMKTRSSSGVGSKIDLDFNTATLKITDPGPDGDGSGPGGHANSANKIMDKIKAKSITTDSDNGQPEGKVTADIKGAKLKGLLNNIKNS